MYRCVLYIYQGRLVLSHAQNPRMLSYKCSNMFSALVFRAAGKVSHRAFWTTGVPCCEKEKGTTCPPLEEVKNDGKRTGQLQVEDVELKRTEGGAKMRSHTEEQNNIEATAEATVDDRQVERKTMTGKQGLLELLGAMKVEGTTKRKLKALKSLRSGEEAPQRPKLEAMESTISMFQQATSEAAGQSESLSGELRAAASAVASMLPDSAQAESELLRQLRKHEAVSDTQGKEGQQSLSNIIAHMKVRRKVNGRPSVQPTNQIRFDDDGRGYTHDRGITSELDGIRRRKSPFSGKRLSIFAVGGDQEKDTDLATRPTLWDIDLANQIAQAVNNIPRNGFEEMIQWTREGKLWQYPINNEAGMEEDATVPFHEHVFLEHHLEDGFPQQGPIRHFMELVITGLAKNHHLSVKQKVEHIRWFRDYFKEKQDILRETEACLS
ncbi:28S ribosomal protein S31, mitochondrial [Electrophorus electricus]|uniref:Small ribosomal subunit protein mS31 n=1 Tax=Electrophorus electricus TaxID=8005 RepID=A0A4W4GJJ0_ELEEL|nr:28S ribosomal protein S31, mitochondrial [Electrophorus electricus]